MGIRPYMHFCCGVTDRVENDPRRVREVNVHEEFTSRYISLPVPNWGGETEALSNAWVEKWWNDYDKAIQGTEEEYPGPPLGEILYNGWTNPDGIYVPSCTGLIIDGNSGDTFQYAMMNALDVFANAGFAIVKRIPEHPINTLAVKRGKASDSLKFCHDHNLWWQGFDHFDIYSYVTEARHMLQLAGWEIPFEQLQLFVVWGWS